MRAFRLCRTTYPAYDGEGARRAGGRWNSKGIRVLYMSENRSLAVLEILSTCRLQFRTDMCWAWRKFPSTFPSRN